MLPKIVCILSDVRSGSTLLQQLLGAHTRLHAVGELQWIKAYELNDRKSYNPPHEMLCACGASFHACEFWSQVRNRVAEDIRSGIFVPRYFAWTGEGSVRRPLQERVPRRVLELNPALFRISAVRRFFGGRKLAADYLRVYNAIAEVSGKEFIVDSSKNTFRYKVLQQSFPQNVFTIVLHRDYRAVVCSRMKRGVSLREGAQQWRKKVNQIETMAKGIDDSRLFRLSYERLCDKPRQVMEEVCEFLGLAFEQEMLERPASDVHDLGGSPSKFQKERRQIVLDTEYLTAFDASQLTEMRKIVGKFAAVNDSDYCAD